MKQIGKRFSCADKSKAYVELVFNPENNVVGVFAHDDEQDDTVVVALSLEDARALAVALLSETSDDGIGLW